MEEIKQKEYWEDDFETQCGSCDLMYNSEYKVVKDFISNLLSQALQKRDEQLQKYVMLTLEQCVTAKSEDGKTMFLRVDAKEFEEGLSTLNTK